MLEIKETEEIRNKMETTNQFKEMITKQVHMITKLLEINQMSKNKKQQSQVCSKSCGEARKIHKMTYNNSQEYKMDKPQKVINGVLQHIQQVPMPKFQNLHLMSQLKNNSNLTQPTTKPRTCSASVLAQSSTLLKPLPSLTMMEITLTKSR